MELDSLAGLEQSQRPPHAGNDRVAIRITSKLDVDFTQSFFIIPSTWQLPFLRNTRTPPLIKQINSQSSRTTACVAASNEHSLVSSSTAFGS